MVRSEISILRGTLESTEEPIHLIKVTETKLTMYLHEERKEGRQRMERIILILQYLDDEDQAT